MSWVDKNVQGGAKYRKKSYMQSNDRLQQSGYIGHCFDPNRTTNTVE